MVVRVEPVAPPDMTGIVVTPGPYAMVRQVVRRLRAQTIRDRIELIVVAPSADALDLPASELDAFRAHHVAGVGPIESRGRAGALGVRHAAAPVVTFIENHSFPDPGWTEALLAAYASPWAAVGPAFRNANPERLWSWTAFLLSHGD